MVPVHLKAWAFSLLNRQRLQRLAHWSVDIVAWFGGEWYHSVIFHADHLERCQIEEHMQSFDRMGITILMGIIGIHTHMHSRAHHTAGGFLFRFLIFHPPRGD